MGFEVSIGFGLVNICWETHSVHIIHQFILPSHQFFSEYSHFNEFWNSARAKKITE